MEGLAFTNIREATSKTCRHSVQCENMPWWVSIVLGFQFSVCVGISVGTLWPIRESVFGFICTQQDAIGGIYETRCLTF